MTFKPYLLSLHKSSCQPQAESSGGQKNTLFSGSQDNLMPAWLRKFEVNGRFRFFPYAGLIFCAFAPRLGFANAAPLVPV